MSEQTGLPAVGTYEPIEARDCWQMAREWNCTPSEAHVRMMAEGWRFWNYSATYGTELYLPPTEEAQP